MNRRLLVAALTVLTVLGTGACTSEPASTARSAPNTTTPATTIAPGQASVTPVTASATPQTVAISPPGNGAPAAPPPAPPAPPPTQTSSAPGSDPTLDRQACRAAYEAQFLLPAAARSLYVLESITSTPQEQTDARNEIVALFTTGSGVLANASTTATTPALRAALDRAADAFAVATVIAVDGSVEEIRSLLADGADLDARLRDVITMCY